MAEFPLDPMLSKTVIAAEKYGCVDEVKYINKTSLLKNLLREHVRTVKKNMFYCGGP